MRGKAGLVVGMAAGYVLGTRDGRGRYDQMVTQARKLWNDPKVQAKATQAQDLVKEKAPQVQEKAAQVADKATSTASAKVDAATSKSKPSPASGPSKVRQSTSGTAAPAGKGPASEPITPATVPVAKGPELHADITPPATPGGSHD